MDKPVDKQEKIRTIEKDSVEVHPVWEEHSVCCIEVSDESDERIQNPAHLGSRWPVGIHQIKLITLVIYFLLTFLMFHTTL